MCIYSVSYEGTHALNQFSPNRIDDIKSRKTQGITSIPMANTTLGAEVSFSILDLPNTIK